jgi:hypothetical protein
MFQRLQTCLNVARKKPSEHNNKSIELSTKYFNPKVKPVEFKEEDWVLKKKHNKKRKLAKTFNGPFRITKVHSNGTVSIRTKTSKHDHLVNTYLLVKYDKPHTRENQDVENQEQNFKIPEPENQT